MGKIGLQKEYQGQLSGLYVGSPRYRPMERCSRNELEIVQLVRYGTKENGCFDELEAKIQFWSLSHQSMMDSQDFLGMVLFETKKTPANVVKQWNTLDILKCKNVRAKQHSLILLLSLMEREDRHDRGRSFNPQQGLGIVDDV